MPPEPILWDTHHLSYDSLELVWDGALPRRPRPVRRRETTPPPPHPHPAPLEQPMSTFQYHPFPLSTGGFTTRVVLGPEIDVAALDSAVAAATAVPVDKCVLVLQAYLQQILAAAAAGGQSTDIHGLFRFRSTSGGSAAGPDDFHTPDDINADVGLSFTKETIRQWRTTLSLESLGVVGKVTPIVDTVLNMVNGEPNHYAVGGLIEIKGDDLKFDRTDTAQGVFLTPASGPAVRATSYGPINPTSIIVNVPASLSGPLTLRVAAFLNGSVRSFTYSIPLVT